MTRRTRLLCPDWQDEWAIVDEFKDLQDIVGGPVGLISNAEKGETFTRDLGQQAPTHAGVPAGMRPFCRGLDHPYLAIGADATDPACKTAG